MTTPSDTPPSGPTPGTGVDLVLIEDEMKRSYLDYAMSVIVSRALPDVRDGLKPVHRRIIYSMQESGYTADKPYRKSARIVGDVMGKYHPHGDAAIYDAMVRMAQGFSMRLPLIDGQGNFGSMDGDRAAAMRYTEARMARSAHALVDDIDKDTVDFQPNYDDTIWEPTVLPARIPNLLVNGVGGIAVGMATNIPPHNLSEVIGALLALIEDPDTSIEQITAEHIQGPDFPTGAQILGRRGIHSAFMTGRGSVVMRGKASIEETQKNREAIIITEIPYQVNKSRMIEIMAETVRDKRIEGISDLRDESDRNGVRVVVEVKRDHQADIVLNQLYRFTPLQTSFGVNMLAIDGGRPKMMNLKEILVAFLDFRQEVIRRRTLYELGKARDKAHVLVGLAVAVANIDDVIALIRAAPNPQVARTQLMDRSWPVADMAPMVELLGDPGHRVEDGDKYRLSETQAKAILELRLHRLTGLERDKISQDLKEISLRIEEYLNILRSRERLLEVLREELVDIRDRFGNPRRTSIEESEFEHDIEDLIQREDMVVTVTNTGYIKRVPLNTYRAQKRGGKGRSGMSTREEDFVSQVFVANTHAPVLFFSSTGIVYKLKVYKLPLGTPQARGKAMVNILPLSEGETITTLMPLPEGEETWCDLSVLFATASGSIRRNRLSDFTNVMVNGKIAMKLGEGDHLVRVRTCTEQDDVLLTTRAGKCIRFRVTDVRVFASRASTGVRGVKLAKGDEVIGMSCLAHTDTQVDDREAYLQAVSASRRLAGADYTGKSEEKARDDASAARLTQPPFDSMSQAEEYVLTVSADGFGRRASSYEYRTANRGGEGTRAMDLTRGEEKSSVIASFPVLDTDQLVMVTDGGQLIRCPVSGISFSSRTARGVTLFRVTEGERVVSVTRIREDDQADLQDDDEEDAVDGNAKEA